MLFDNPALQQLKQDFDSAKVKKEGIVKASDRGFGFLELTDRRESIFIAPQNMKKVLHGDRISAVIEDGKDGKKQAVPEKLIESSLKRFVARISINQGNINVIADSPTIKNLISANDNRKDKSQKLKQGDFVICNLSKHALNDNNFKASIIEYITDANDPKIPWTVSLRRLDLPLEPPSQKDPFVFLESDLERVDMTDKPFVTIDSQKTKDMDDALYIEKTDDGFTLYVAIADPTGYIDENSSLDKEASIRSFSIYLPGRDIPMLPRELSDDLCSLKENEIRPSLVAKIKVLQDGTVIAQDAEFCLANIKSYKKLIYNDVSDFLETNKNEANYDDVIQNQLKILKEFALARDSYRCKYSAPFKDRPDYEFILDENGALESIEVNYRRIGNRIVEESMISANIVAGEILASKLNCGIFNTHLGFDLGCKDEILDLLKREGFDKATEESIATIEGFNEVRRFAVAQESGYLDCRIRRLQEYSQISITPAPHYALGLNFYATWTSPIRKYGDMINHRLIKSLICAKEHPRMPNDETLNIMNTARRSNRIAERDVKDWLYVDYLEKDFKEGKVFEAEILDISKNGMRVTLLQNGATVFMPASMFTDSFDIVEFKNLTGEVLVDGKVALRLSDIITVKIVDINKPTRSIIAAPTVGLPGIPLPSPKKSNVRKK